jgi:hypothetical protein
VEKKMNKNYLFNRTRGFLYPSFAKEGLAFAERTCLFASDFVLKTFRTAVPPVGVVYTTAYFLLNTILQRKEGFMFK